MYVSAYSKYMLEKLLRDLQETWMRSGHLYNEEIKQSTNSKTTFSNFFNSIQTGCRVLMSKFSSTRILSIRCIHGRLGHGLYSLTPPSPSAEIPLASIFKDQTHYLEIVGYCIYIWHFICLVRGLRI